MHNARVQTDEDVPIKQDRLVISISFTHSDVPAIISNIFKSSNHN